MRGLEGMRHSTPEENACMERWQEETLRTAVTNDGTTREAELRMMVKFLTCMLLHEKCFSCPSRYYPELCKGCWVRTIKSDVRKLGVEVDDGN